ncbi:MAG: type VII toxin-antitoxin system HepT family RNase toxin [bacterium]
MVESIISQKIESLRRCLWRIESKQPFTEKQLTHNFDLQDIIVLNLTRAVQLCVDLASHLLADSNNTVPATMGETFTELARFGMISEANAQRMRKAVGFRNIAVHDYQKINWFIVYLICTQHLQDFHDFAQAIIHHIGLDE